ncbi:dephospho-CoA kinase [Hoylesella buccalis]|uniref:dephospho-CoA kinase n=1 Tax=Hoylesella buccalis TaxID=28127 RepID=UPI0026EA8E49|nr:dephospho-CoA kinase [Hoylesella buccalis]
MNNSKSIVALTGGIGSGKSYVCQLLSQHGIVVYDCDEAAKRLMREDSQLRQQLIQLVGRDVYEGTKLQKSVLAQFLLASEANKQAVNDIVHPAVATDFLQSSLQWVESAILFDAHFDRRIKPDMVICVTAPLEIRVERIMRRDGISHEKATAWINSQMPQEEMVRLSDMELVNDGKANLPQQIEKFLEQLHRNHIL